MIVEIERPIPIGWRAEGTYTERTMVLAKAPLPPPTPTLEVREFCAHCWGAGKVYEMAGGRMQFPATPCDECFGTGFSWRAK